MTRIRLLAAALVMATLSSIGVAEQIAVRLEATDLGGLPISVVQVGDQFQLNAYIADIRDAPKGVYSAYIDITSTPELVSIAHDSVSHGDSFGHGAYVGNSAEAILNDTGSLSLSNDQYGSEERLLFTASILAETPGTVAFASGADALLPRRATTLHGLTTAIDASEFLHDSTQVTIVVPEPTSLCLIAPAAFLLFVFRRHR